MAWGILDSRYGELRRTNPLYAGKNNDDPEEALQSQEGRS